ncbi:MAG: hypothetical protein P1P81_11195 [Desulfobulbales bacterium]|nr:hypothetical protein [Desulfobulbales bacterium]
MTRLSGWQEIVDYAKRSESTLKKWKKDFNFPIIKLGGCVESDTVSIDKWWQRIVESDMQIDDN